MIKKVSLPKKEVLMCFALMVFNNVETLPKNFSGVIISNLT